MGVNLKDRWSVPVTAVPDCFIDEYMAGANGEYVKVYLYVLRHRGELLTVESIADALNHTESDVNRALTYWTKAGILIQDGGEKAARGDGAPEVRRVREMAAGREPEEKQKAPAAAGASHEASPALVNRLAEDEEFSQLLYIAQKYLNRVFTTRDCQVFAYLYGELGMSSELLEYLVEYCAQNDHISVRYLETVALSWHERGIRTVQQARDVSASYTKDAFCVMKAFGLNGRKPGQAEQRLIDKWFGPWGFDRELVAEACNRTIGTIHTPSFQYADKILSDWRKAGVKTLADVRAQDEKRLSPAREQDTGRERRMQRYGEAASAQKTEKSGKRNQFHNFTQRDTDYDALVMQQVKEWAGQKQ